MLAAGLPRGRAVAEIRRLGRQVFLLGSGQGGRREGKALTPIGHRRVADIKAFSLIQEGEYRLFGYPPKLDDRRVATQNFERTTISNVARKSLYFNAT